MNVRRSGTAIPGSARPLPSGLVTFLFTDIEGSTRLFARLGDAYPNLLAIHNELVRAAIAAEGGVEVRTIGDAFFVAFPDATVALTACVLAQLALERHPWPPDGRIRVRMGLHTGAAQPTDGDYIALAVHQAARVSSAAHGGQVLVSSATAAHAGELAGGATLEPLGEYRLKDFDEPQVLRQLRHPDLPHDFPALKIPATGAGNLPRPRTSFIGRSGELGSLRRLLGESALVTVVGPGGCGKTRLAVETVTEAIDDFPDGGWFVDLAPLESPALVLPTIAAALGVREPPGTVLEDALIERLRDRTALVLLDNCEHLVEECAGVVDRLLYRSPTLTVLATSREPLRVRGETLLRLSPLPVPAADAPPEVVLAEDATRLFLERTAASAELSDDRSLRAIAVICKRLDGLPLAIELAAARARTVSVEEIATRLDERFTLLTRGHRTDLPRQQTLRALIDWSHALLDSAERTLFARLAVFAGGFRAAAAAEICDFEPLEAEEVLDLLASLEDKSLLEIDRSTPEVVRFRMLETIRSYASEMLAGGDDETAVRHRHLSWYARHASRAADAVRGSEVQAWHRELAAETDNLRTALSWSGEAADTAATGLQLAERLGPWWRASASSGEGRQLITELLSRASGVDPELQAAAVATLGSLERAVGDVAAAEAHLRTALDLASAGPALPRARIGLELTACLLWKGTPEALTEAQELGRLAVATVREHGDRDATARGMATLGAVTASLGDLGSATGLLQEAVQEATLGDTRPPPPTRTATSRCCCTRSGATQKRSKRTTAASRQRAASATSTGSAPRCTTASACWSCSGARPRPGKRGGTPWRPRSATPASASSPATSAPSGSCCSRAERLRRASRSWRPATP